MKKWVEDAVADLARAAIEQDDELGHVMLPIVVYGRVRTERPDVHRHIRRYSNHDPYQIVHGLIPEDVIDLAMERDRDTLGDE